MPVSIVMGAPNRPPSPRSHENRLPPVVVPPVDVPLLEVVEDVPVDEIPPVVDVEVPVEVPEPVLEEAAPVAVPAFEFADGIAGFPPAVVPPWARSTGSGKEQATAKNARTARSARALTAES